MNIQELSKILINAGIEPNEAKYEIKLLAEHFCGYSEMDRIKGKRLTDEQISLLKDKVRLRADERIPVQYITGEAWFMGNYFKVTQDVLIPRDETEILVTKAIEVINGNDFKKVLDIGTGSGCIACTIAQKTDAEVLGTDISNDALRVALDNVTKLGINSKAVFRKSDLFESIREEEKFDLIISNPPYIPYGVKLDKELDYEPKTALFAEDDGLKFYREISKYAPEYLNNNGYLMFELGYGEAEAVQEFMSESFCGIEIIKDLAGIDRIIIGKFMK